MAETILITIADVSVYRKIDPKFNQDRFNAFASEVQRKNLRGLLGDALYYDFFANSEAEKYAKLITGEAYDGIQFYGIKPILCYWFLALATREGDLFHTGFGAAQFINNPQQSFETAKEKERIAVGYMDTAQAYENDLINYLNAKRDTYPLWKVDTEKNGQQFLTFRI
jgi:hypothetical protein